MSNKISFILYEKAALPRHYEINKKIFQMALYGFPGIALVSLAGALLMGVYVKEMRGVSIEQFAVSPTQFLEENKALSEEIEDLQNIVWQLQTKLAETPSTAKVGGTWIEYPPNSKKITEISISIESPKASIRNNQLHFKFNLSNKLKTQTRLRGFVHVIMKKDNGLFFWPSLTLQSKKLTAPYNSGEPFSTRYFRPVSSVFPLPATGDNKYVFFIMVHGLTGDLLHYQRVEQTVETEAGQ